MPPATPPATLLPPPLAAGIRTSGSGSRCARKLWLTSLAITKQVHCARGVPASTMAHAQCECAMLSVAEVFGLKGASNPTMTQPPQDTWRRAEHSPLRML
eukprot:14983611-Alexandrium_andersonii.AAC.1